MPSSRTFFSVLIVLILVAASSLAVFRLTHSKGIVGRPYPVATTRVPKPQIPSDVKDGLQVTSSDEDYWPYPTDIVFLKLVDSPKVSEDAQRLANLVNGKVSDIGDSEYIVFLPSNTFPLMQTAISVLGSQPMVQKAWTAQDYPGPFSLPFDPSMDVSDPRGGTYPVNQVLLTVYEGTSRADVEALAASVHGKIIGYFPSDGYQFELPTRTIAELDAMLDTLKSDGRVKSVARNVQTTTEFR